MPRFTPIPPPLEERVGNGIVSQLRSAVGLGVALHERLNRTVHDREISDKTTNAVFEALQPGSLPCVLLVVVMVALGVHSVLVRYHTNLILSDHGHFSRDEKQTHVE